MSDSLSDRIWMLLYKVSLHPRHHIKSSHLYNRGLTYGVEISTQSRWYASRQDTGWLHCYIYYTQETFQLAVKCALLALPITRQSWYPMTTMIK